MFADQEHLAPGFSHGTAGVAYALAAAGRRLNRPDLVGALHADRDTRPAPMGLEPSWL